MSQLQDTWIAIKDWVLENDWVSSNIILINDLIANNFTLSKVAGLLTIIITIVGTGFLAQFGKRSFDLLLEKKSSTKGQVVGLPISEPDNTQNKLRQLSSQDLINLYGKQNPPFGVTIGGNERTFAATRVIEPSGSGAIDQQKIDFRYVDTWFKLDNELSALTRSTLEAIEGANDKDLFNGDPFRIVDISIKGERTEIVVGRCKYFDSLRTSYSLDIVLPTIRKSLREFLQPEGAVFEPLGKSRLPNHMGLVVLIETMDGQLVVQKRSTKVQNRTGTLSASVTGTFEKSDLSSERNRSLSFKAAMRGVMREVHSELGGDYDSDISGLYFLGLMREFRRGGFPDFYFYCEAQYSFEQVLRNAKHAEEAYEIDEVLGYYAGGRFLTKDALKEKKAFDDRISNILRSIDGKSNLTLKLGIALYYDLISRRVNSFEN